MLEKLFILLRFSLDNQTFLKFQLDALDKLAMGINRLVEPDPTLRAAPVGRGEYLEARNVPAAPAVPKPSLAQFDPKVRIRARNMELIDWQTIQPLFRSIYHTHDFAPLCDRIGIVQKTSVDNLSPVFSFGETRFFRHRRRAVESQNPSKLPLVLFFVPPLPIRLHGPAPRHDLFRMDPLQRLHIRVADDKNGVVDLISQAAEVFAREKIYLVLFGIHVEISRDVEFMVRIWNILGDGICSRFRNGLHDLRVKRFGIFVGDDMDHLAFLDALSSPKREVHQHIGVFLEYFLIRSV